MVKASARLRAKIQVFRNNLSRSDTYQKYEPLGADEDTMDGLNVHGAIIDELHAHKTRGVYDVIDTATGARRQPMIYAITTAGTDQTDASICWEQHIYAEQVLRGTIQDDGFFALIFALDESDDWKVEQHWYKANPNLGVSKKLDYMRRQAKKAEHMPGFLNTFLRLELNRWTNQATRWIDLGQWDAQAGPVIDESALAGRVCYGGLDLSSVSDITAWVLLFPEPDGEGLTIVCRLWCPEARLNIHEDVETGRRRNRYGEAYQVWARDGVLLTTPGNAIDYTTIQAQIVEDAKRFSLQSIGIDRLFQGYQLAMQLQEDHGITVAACGMGYTSMAGPCSEFERRLLGKHLHHGGHPVLRWMANNVAVRENPTGSKKPDKISSQGKIDGIVGILLALDRIMRQQPETESIYETRGLLTLGGNTDGQTEEAGAGAAIRSESVAAKNQSAH
jgi:phage terminase large subunit-like protein